jgi:biopolymer transport protein ExbD
MTPLIDVAFLLLIAFIITIPLMENGIMVKLPRGRAAKLQPRQTQHVTVDAAGKIFINNRATTLGDLEKTLSGLIAGDPETSVLVRGDERLHYGQVVEVMKVLYKVKVTRMALVTQGE